MSLYYLDELTVGMRFESPSFIVSKEDIKRFAGEFDPQPFHLDDHAAGQSLFGGLAASGWHTAALTMKLFVDGGLPIAGGLIGLGGEIAWPRPTRPGDALHVVGVVREIHPSRSKPGQGIVIADTQTLNGQDEVVQTFTAKLIVFTREAARARLASAEV